MNNEDYLSKLNVVNTECCCDHCKSMCHAPCGMSVEDAEKLIDAGYADRLMFDDLPSVPDGGSILKPALKKHEGKRAPYNVRSIRGCTFWNEQRLCDLHHTGLKPIQGKITIHGENAYCYDKLAEISKEDWESPRGLAVIDRWKKLVNYNPDL